MYWEWGLVLVVAVLVFLYGLYTVYNLSNALGDYLRNRS
jgi:hypothetical protein